MKFTSIPFQLSLTGRNLILSLTLAVCIFSPVGQPAVAQTGTPKLGAIHLEAEAATLHGTVIAATRTGFSGTGYVNGLDTEGDRLVWELPNAAPGIYEVRLRYSAPNGERGYEYSVNGAKSSGMMLGTGEGFVTAKIGRIELLPGANSFAVEKGWGYYDVDAIDLIPATRPPALKKIPLKLSNPAATRKTRALMAYLLDQYGKKTISGQQQTALKESEDMQYIATNTGKIPGILGGDMIEYSPSRVEHGAKPEGTTEWLIDNTRKGRILTVMWHWNAPTGLYNRTYTNAEGKSINAPWWRGFYSDATTFDLQQALDNPDSAEYKLLIRDMDVIAAELKKIQAADIPVLWRPLHEAEGRWFWWGAKGPEPLKKLWRLMFDRYTKHHKLNNLIWVYTSSAKMDWYPGDAYVDIIGVDAYPQLGDPLTAIWDDLRAQFDGKKLLTLSEIGAVPDVDKMHRFGVTWSYFMSWNNFRDGATPAQHELFKKVYNSPLVLNQGEFSIASQWQQQKTVSTR